MNINTIALILADGDKDLAEIKAYYLKTMIHTVTTLLAILAASYFLDVFQYALIITLSFWLLRTKTGGCHSKSINLCKLYSFLMVLGLAMLVPEIKISQVVLIIWSLFVIVFGLYLIYKVVPIDSPQRPILSQQFRKELKIKAYIFFALLMSAIYIFSLNKYFEAGVAILLAVTLQLLLMTKMGYWVIAKVDCVFNVK